MIRKPNATEPRRYSLPYLLLIGVCALLTGAALAYAHADMRHAEQAAKLSEQAEQLAACAESETNAQADRLNAWRELASNYTTAAAMLTDPSVSLQERGAYAAWLEKRAHNIVMVWGR